MVNSNFSTKKKNLSSFYKDNNGTNRAFTSSVPKVGRGKFEKIIFFFFCYDIYL